MIRLSRITMAVSVVAFASQGAAASPPRVCQAVKNRLAGAYAYCLETAEARFAVAADVSRLIAAEQSCRARYETRWALVESKASAAGAPCPSVGDQDAIQRVTFLYSFNVSTALAGGTLYDCQADLDTCRSSLLVADLDLDRCQADLATCETCESDLRACNGSLASALDTVTAYQNSLAQCDAAPHGRTIRTEQTQCWDSTGASTACLGTGQDGEQQSGLGRRYTDNGDGTIIDENTGLVWEKLSSDGSIHDVSQTYTWDDALTMKMASLNATAFGGNRNWRLPNVNELQSIVSYGTLDPSVSAAFDTSCGPGCTVATCSCTSGAYWSSTTYQGDPTSAWGVSFFDGLVSASGKIIALGVRAVSDGTAVNA